MTLRESRVGPDRVSGQRIWSGGAGWLDDCSSGLYTIGTKTYVQFRDISGTFTRSGSTYASDNADGATLIVDDLGYFIYTLRDGTKLKFDKNRNNEATITNSSNHCPAADPAICQIPLTITAPSGLEFTLGWSDEAVRAVQSYEARVIRDPRFTPRHELR
ncbi:MAG TPA: hypothetical protein VKC17_13050 [Sphingomicrobium sp.]|nr:hypothetical protein [Sphingomicrobium sp.]